MSTFKIQNFIGGLNQAVADDILAVEQCNVDISSGTLKTMSGYSK